MIFEEQSRSSAFVSLEYLLLYACKSPGLVLMLPITIIMGGREGLAIDIRSMLKQCTGNKVPRWFQYWSENNVFDSCAREKSEKSAFKLENVLDRL